MIRVSDYLAQRIVEEGITDAFSVVGGAAMYLNHAFACNQGLHVTYQHHEQASAMAAEAYARVNNRMAVVSVTSGPGAVNAMTGVLCAWMESIPMLVMSGQVRVPTTVRSTGLSIRSFGIQEYDITRSTSAMTKYSVMVERPEDIRYDLEKALYLAMHGRRGPVWLDLPLDVQSAVIDPDALVGFDPEAEGFTDSSDFTDDEIRHILCKIKEAARPVLFAGYGIRAAGAYESFRELVPVLGIPVITGSSSKDLLPYDAPLYAGVSGMTGSRAGNFALQNADVLLSLGSRQSLIQTGFDYKDWARDAYTILNDLDEEELKKPNLHVSYPVVGDVKVLISRLMTALRKDSSSEIHPFFHGREWIDRCVVRKKTYPPVTKEEKSRQADGRANIYCFYDALSDALAEDETLLVSCGTSRVAAVQAFRVKEGQRMITNSATASMGYGLPAAIGACIAGGGAPVTLVTGEGSVMMNLQELQTIAGNELPIRIFLISNGGYHSIRQTEENYFGKPYYGIGPESHDLTFPDFSKLMPAFGFRYCDITCNEVMRQEVTDVLAQKQPVLCEVFVTPAQATSPKSSSRTLKNGDHVTAPLEDMAPFLSRGELRMNMEVPLTADEERE